MAHLTDAQHKTVGHTVLYVPDEGDKMEDAQAYLDKELVQRLEGNLKRREQGGAKERGIVEKRVKEKMRGKNWLDATK